MHYTDFCCLHCSLRTEDTLITSSKKCNRENYWMLKWLIPEGGFPIFLKSLLWLWLGTLSLKTHKNKCILINAIHHGCNGDALLTKYINFIINLFLQLIICYFHHVWKQAPMPLELLQYRQVISKLSGVSTSFYTNYLNYISSNNSHYCIRKQALRWCKMF